MRITSLVCLLPLLLSLPATSAQEVPSTEDLNSMGLEVRWQGQAELDVRSDRIRHVTNDTQNIYVQSKRGILSAFDAENGRLLWTTQVGRKDEPELPATSNSDLVIVTAGPSIYGYNKFTGQKLIEHRMLKQPTTQPVMTEKELYIPTTGGSLYVYSLSTLQYKFRYNQLPETIARPFIWRFTVNEFIRYAPVIGEDGVVFATESGNLHAAGIRGSAAGSTNYQVKLTAPVTAPLAIAPSDTDYDVLFAAGPKIVSADTTRGRINWEYAVGSDISTAPIIIGDDIFLLNEEGQLLKLTRNTSSPDWGRPITVPRMDAPNMVGAGFETVPVTDQQRQRLRISAQEALKVVSISPGSIAESSGLQVGDVIHSLNELPVSDPDAFMSQVSELALRREHSFYAFGSDEIERRVRFRIPITSWQVEDLDQLCTIGRFSVYAIDSSGRLTAVDRQTGDFQNRIEIPGFDQALTNSTTDQLYLLAGNGRILALREIGPTVVVPDESNISQTAILKERSVARGDRVTADTTLCVLTIDGEDLEVKAGTAGVVHGWFAVEGDELTTGSAIARIADDQFANYYRDNDDQPLDVDVAP